MKKLLSVITAAAVLLGSTIAYASASEPVDEFAVETNADTADVENQADLLEYTELEDGTLEVICPYYNRSRLTNVVIPSEMNGKKVTRIGDSAFCDCKKITNVTIPNSIKSIGDFAFRESALSSLTIPDGVTSIGEFAFVDCTKLSSIVIPNGVTNIEVSTFSGCTSLTSVTIPDSVTAIGSSAFSKCTSLTSITIPEGVTTIDRYAFSGCTNLATVSLPKTVMVLENDYVGTGVYDLQTHVFVGCSGLKAINVSAGGDRYYSLDGVLYAKYTDERNVERHALVWYPHGKEEISYTIPESVISIADGAIDERSKLENIYVDPNNDYYESIDGVLFSSGGHRLKQYPAGRKQTHYTIPDSVWEMSEDAFAGCTNLVSVTMPEGIERAYFSGCTNLETINLPSSLTHIYFEACTSLKCPIVIPDGVMELGWGTFKDCKNIPSVVMSDSVKNTGYYVFADCENLASLKLSDNLAAIEYFAFWNCRSLASVKIPNSVTKIAYGAFGSCTSLKSISIPQSVKSIEESAFQYCTSLKSVRIPSSVEKLGGYAFYNAENLETVSILGSINKIDFRTFYGCTNLNTITIPSSVKSIENNAFWMCENLKDVYYAGTKEQWTEVYIGNYNDPLKNATIHYNSTGPDIKELPIEIELPKPAAGAPETENMQVTLKQGDSIIDTIPINDDGTLDLSGVPDGEEYTFTFSADNCAPRSYTVNISSGTVTGLEDGIELRLYGDIDDKGDGIVDIRDVAKANMYFKTGTGLSGYMLTVSDVNGDNVINIKDVALMNAHFKQTGNLWKE